MQALYFKLYQQIKFIAAEFRLKLLVVNGFKFVDSRGVVEDLGIGSR